MSEALDLIAWVVLIFASAWAVVGVVLWGLLWAVANPTAANRVIFASVGVIVAASILRVAT